MESTDIPEKVEAPKDTNENQAPITETEDQPPPDDQLETSTDFDEEDYAEQLIDDATEEAQKVVMVTSLETATMNLNKQQDPTVEQQDLAKTEEALEASIKEGDDTATEERLKRAPPPPPEAPETDEQLRRAHPPPAPPAPPAPAADADTTATTAATATTAVSGQLASESLPMTREVNSESGIPTAPELPYRAEQEEASTEEFLQREALNLSWCFGFNSQLPVINLSNEVRHAICYASGSATVVLQWHKNQQKLLRGHFNDVTSLSVSDDRRWLVTADSGEQSTVIVWDTDTYLPIRTIFDVHPLGCTAAVIRQDARYILTLAIPPNEPGFPQTISLWDWLREEDTPLGSITLDASKLGVMTFASFNSYHPNYFALNSDTKVVLCCFSIKRPAESVNGSASTSDHSSNGATATIDHFPLNLTDSTFNKPVGRYTSKCLYNKNGNVITGTSIGLLVVWDSIDNKEEEPTIYKRPVKLLRSADKAISVLTQDGDFMITGDAGGEVRIYDQSLKMRLWYSDLNIGSITNVDFDYRPRFMTKSNMISVEESEYPNESTVQGRRLPLKDFIISSQEASVLRITVEGTDIKVLLREHDSAVKALDAHPSSSIIVIGSYTGLLQIWDYERKEVQQSRFFQERHIQCCQFDPSGSLLAVAFLDGALQLLDALSLRDESDEFNWTQGQPITHCAFSLDSVFLATADAGYTITLYQNDPVDHDWKYLGRYKSHYQPIQDIMFGCDTDTGEPRLLSLGADRVLVEYDLAQTEPGNIVLHSTERIEQYATPTCMCWYPKGVTKENFIVTANDHFKYRLYNATTKMCRKTLLSPTFGSPLQKIVVLPGEADLYSNPAVTDDERYLVYITLTAVGLQIVPLDGNPHNTASVMAHASGVSDVCVSNCGRFVFTAGGTDTSVHMWTINLDALKAHSRLGGDGMLPFYDLIEGGRDGPLFKQLEDYFYYSLLRTHGLDAMETRTTANQIPLSEIPFVMRALGFYPTEQEIDDMNNEVKFRDYVDTGEYVTEIDLEEVIKLWVNHRPAFGHDFGKIQWAFQVLQDEPARDKTEMLDGSTTDELSKTSISRANFLEWLQSKGEHMTEYELAECLMTLVGETAEGGASENHELDISKVESILSEGLADQISVKYFIEDLLSFNDADTDNNPKES